jgi:hypothetical protein
MQFAKNQWAKFKDPPLSPHCVRLIFTEAIPHGEAKWWSSSAMQVPATASSRLRAGEIEPAQPECRRGGAGGSVRFKRLMRPKPPPHRGEVCALSALCALSPRIGHLGIFDGGPQSGGPSTPGAASSASPVRWAVGPMGESSKKGQIL